MASVAAERRLTREITTLLTISVCLAYHSGVLTVSFASTSPLSSLGGLAIGAAEYYDMEVTDSDQDGLDDPTELRLLNRYAPYLCFTSGEDYRPCSAMWYVRQSSLVPAADEGARKVIERAVLDANPEALLTANQSGSNLGSSNLLENPQRTAYCLNPKNDSRHGELGWADIFARGNVGVYGHVVPWTNPATSRILHKVEYWLFYGYSEPEAPLDIGDHEGDWEHVSLLVDPSTQRIVKTFHYVHGKEIGFDFTAQGVIRRSTSQGNIVEFRGPNYSTGNINCHSDSGLRRAQNNLVRLAYDPALRDYTHIVVYVERNSHASWPSEYWRYVVTVGGVDYSAPPHRGNANPYLTRDIPSLGEVEHPSSSEARVILQYNGRWGAYRGHANYFAANDTPPGPQLHWQWVWPTNSQVRRRIPDSSFTDSGTIFRP